jgi:hypothetical protein
MGSNMAHRVYTAHGLKELSCKHKSPRLHRWSLEIQQYQFTITHTPGRHNLIADALSRRSYDVNAIQTNSSSNINSVNSGSTAKDEQSDLNPVRIEVNFEYRSQKCPNMNVVTTEPDPSEDLNNESTVLSDPPNHSNIDKYQRLCPQISPIIEFLENGTLPVDPTVAKKVANVANQYEMLNGVLYHFYQPRRKQSPKDERLIRQLAIPMEMRSAVLRSFHDSVAGGAHLGLQRTFAAIRLRYYFPGMYQFIHDYIQSCTECQQAKSSRHPHPAPLTSMPVQDIFQIHRPSS